VVFDYRGVKPSARDANSTRELLIDGDAAPDLKADQAIANFILPAAPPAA
jgi:hypothetical protein